MKRRGFTLIGMIAFAGLYLTMTIAILSQVNNARARVEYDKQRQQAILLALSALDCTRHHLAHGLWTVPQHFRSPDLDGGWFEVWVDTPVANHTIARCVGHFGRSVETVERRLP